MWFDAGVNLTNQRLLKSLPEVMTTAEEAGVTKQLVIATSLEETRAAIKLCEQYPQQLLMTAGIHPHDAGEATECFAEELSELAAHEAVVAIGECGLDFHRNYSPQERQEAVFIAQIKVANQLKLPLYLHERDAIDKQIELLNRYCDDDITCLTHCFTGGPKEAHRYLERGHWFGVTGWICDERRNGQLIAALPNIPLERLVLETDAPFLLPRGIKPRPKMNEPKFLPTIGHAVSNAMNIPLNELAKQTTENAKRLFNV